MRKLKRVPINILPGTHPALDSTALSSVRCIETDKVYFKRVDNQTYIRPLKSWSIFVDTTDVTQEVVDQEQLKNMVGIPRTQSWHIIDGNEWLITGSTRKLYATLITGETYDITPLRTSSTAAANSIATTIGSADIVVTFVGHGLLAGDYVRLSGATDTGGILAADINTTFAVKSATSNTFTVTTDGGTASSTVSGGGGAGTVVFRQVPYSETRVWAFENFGDILVVCPGEDGAIYEWDGDAGTLPTAVTNAPTANWVFVSNNAVVALGAAGQYNRIHASGIGDRNVWTAGAGSTAWSDDAEGIGAFVSQVRSRDTNLLFTNHEVLAFKYVGLPNLWEWDYVMTSDGINSAVARASIDDVVYWQGWTGVPYWFDGSSAAPIPNNTLIENMRANTQDLTAFVRPMPELRQVWFYNATFSVGIPTTASYAIFDYDEQHWTQGTHDATCAENPARRLLADNDAVFGYGESSTATARLYSVDGSGDYTLDESGDVDFTLRTSYMSLDQNSRAEILEFMADVGNNFGQTFGLTITTADNPVNEGSTGAEGMATTEYTFDPDNANGVLLVDAVGKYWSLDFDKNGGAATDWVIGKMMLGIQQGVPL